MVKAKEIYNYKQVMKSCIFMIVTYIPLFCLTFDLKAEALYNDPVKTVWQRLFDVFCNTPLLPMHYWIVLSIMFFLTMGNCHNYIMTIRHKSRKDWLMNEIGYILGNNIIFSLFYTFLVIIMTFMKFGWPTTSTVFLNPEAGVSVVYSLSFVVFSTTVLRTISGITICLAILYFHLRGVPKNTAILIGGFYEILSVFILFYGTFLKNELYKFFIFPANISHFFFLSGVPINNFIAGIAIPFALCLFLTCAMFYRIKQIDMI